MTPVVGDVLLQLAALLATAVGHWQLAGTDFEHPRVRWYDVDAYTASAWPLSAESGYDCAIGLGPGFWTVLPPDWRQGVIDHELGHCLGLWEHYPGGVMSNTGEYDHRLGPTQEDLARARELHPYRWRSRMPMWSAGMTAGMQAVLVSLVVAFGWGSWRIVHQAWIEDFGREGEGDDGNDGH